MTLSCQLSIVTLICDHIFYANTVVMNSVYVINTSFFKINGQLVLRFFDSDDMYSPLCSLVYFKGIEECGMATAISFQGREFLML